MKILITGGAGYIGSVTNRFLRDIGHTTVIFDNLSTGRREACGDTELIVGDLKNKDSIQRAMSGKSFDAVIHFAALALAGESMEKPYAYYENNIVGGLNLVEAMRGSGCNTLVFSSTCAVYGFPDTLPVTEVEEYKPVSVYGSSKRMFEEILEWYGNIFQFRYVNLRYFNASGAYPGGMLGEAHPVETHIIPIALDVALGRRSEFSLYGDNYQTPDGTCIRDYIHVMDLADAHLKALEYMRRGGKSDAFNLGVGKGYSNKEVITTVEQVTGKKIPLSVVPRRPGDPDSIYADNTKARTALEWDPKYSDITTIVESAWKWHTRHP